MQKTFIDLSTKIVRKGEWGFKGLKVKGLCACAQIWKIEHFCGNCEAFVVVSEVFNVCSYLVPTHALSLE